MGLRDKHLLAEVAQKNGGKALNAAIDALLPAPAKKGSLLGGVAGAVAVRVATRSVPGAIVVGGALIAKRLYDLRHAARAAKAREKVKPGS